MNILLVGDDRRVAHSVAHDLRSAGHLVTIAHSCSDARLIASYFDLGVFDLLLVDGSGLEFAGEMLAAGIISAALVTPGGSAA